MKKRGLIYMAALCCGMFLPGGCSKTEESGMRPGEADSALAVRFRAEQRDTAAGDAGDAIIETVTAYRFVGGVLCEALPGTGNSDGYYTFYPTDRAGEILFVANDRTGIFSETSAGVTTLGAFHEIEASAEEMSGERLLMSGRAEFSDTQDSPATVTMRRSVARLDLEVRERGVEVRGIAIRGIARKGYVLGGDAPTTPSDAAREDFEAAYDDAPLANTTRTLLYLCEQSGEAPVAEVVVAFGGGEHRMTAALPATILRNRVYTLRVHGAGAGLGVSVSTDGWEAGAETDAAPDLLGRIDAAASQLCEGVTVNSAGDSVRVAYSGGEFRLAVFAGAGSQIDIEGAVRGVTANVEPTRALKQVANVSVQSAPRFPGEEQSYLWITARRGEELAARIVLVFEPNPIQVSGALTFDENGVCDFGKYVDGELGRLTLPDGKIVRAEFAQDEDAWLKLVGQEGSWRVLGGWKPNDPKADGRTQQAQIVVSDADGSHAERYTVRRRNEGLPVVRIGQTWWCKYNLRGDATSFDDQISIQDDPAADTALADYLAACDDDLLLQLLGDQYQGGYPDGLPLRHNGEAFYHEGMRSSAQNFGTLDPTAMAPDGYRIPSYDDYAFLSANENFNLGGVGSRTYTNSAGESLTIRILERDATLFGKHYGTVSFYEFRTEEGCWVLCGLGHQWDTTPGNIARMTLLLATYGNSAKSWFMEGYAQNDRPNQNWLKYTSQNSTKTRVIRCVKTPVEYIYE